MCWALSSVLNKYQATVRPGIGLQADCLLRLAADPGSPAGARAADQSQMPPAGIMGGQRSAASAWALGDLPLVQREQRTEFVAIETEGACFVTDLRGWVGPVGLDRKRPVEDRLLRRDHHAALEVMTTT